MRSLFAAVLAGAVLVACSSGPDSSETSECTVPFDGVAVDTAKELVITDDSVLHDDRAMNRSDGTWSFRARMRELAPPGVTPAQATYEWLASYGRLQRINGFDVAPLEDGQIDGLVAYVTNESLLVKGHGFDTVDLPFADNGLPFVAESVMTTDDILKNDPDKVKAFLEAEIKGWKDACSDLEGGAKLAVDTYGK